jgi:anti-anti-sigma factor
MPDTPFVMTIALVESPSDEATERLRTWLDDGVAVGIRQVTIELDAVSRLEAPLIATLIKISRKARENGTEVRLVTTRATIRATLRATGLDQLFHMVT